MGHKLTASEETALLQRVTREAHEATRAARQATREARQLADQLVSDFEAIHAREIQQLSNYFTEESNRHAASLNADVERARAMIFEEIMAGTLVLNPLTGELSLRWGDVRFDERQPLPYPQTPPKEHQP